MIAYLSGENPKKKKSVTLQRARSEENYYKVNPKKKRSVILQRAKSEDTYYKEFPEKKIVVSPKGMFDYTEQDKINERNKLYNQINTGKQNTLKSPSYVRDKNTGKIRQYNVKKDGLRSDIDKGIDSINESIDNTIKNISEFPNEVVNEVKSIFNFQWYHWLLIGGAGAILLYMFVKLK